MPGSCSICPAAARAELDQLAAAARAELDQFAAAARAEFDQPAAAACAELALHQASPPALLPRAELALDLNADADAPRAPAPPAAVTAVAELAAVTMWS